MGRRSIGKFQMLKTKCKALSDDKESEPRTLMLESLTLGTPREGELDVTNSLQVLSQRSLKTKFAYVIKYLKKKKKKAGGGEFALVLAAWFHVGGLRKFYTLSTLGRWQPIYLQEKMVT